MLAGRGDDEVRTVGSLADEQLTIDGGAGDDTLLGSNGADVIRGGSGRDFVDGQQGADVAELGDGPDTFQWDPGDSSDTVDGGDGDDVLDFNGSNIGEILDVSANGDRARLTCNVANIVMDLDGIERAALDPIGGSDAITVGDLSGTDLAAVDTSLDATGGGGDGQPDAVTARGTDGADRFAVASEPGAVSVTGLGAQVRATGIEPADDVNVDGAAGDDVTTYGGTADADDIAIVANGTEVRTTPAAAASFDTVAVEDLVVATRGGADKVSAVGNLAPLTRITMEGGRGSDTLLGSNGADLIRAGGADDFVDGQQGADVAELGRGSDTFQWDPGDGNDVVEGGAGTDALAFNGSNIGELIDVSANAGRTRLTRNIANIVMDLDGLERLGVRVLGGTDTVTVGDLGGTGVGDVDVDLALTGGATDPVPDTVVVNGTEHRDVVRLTRSGDQVLATGLAATTRITGSELLSDTLRVLTHGGDDAVLVSPAVEVLITPVIDLGADE
ncbi:MAG TPA: calcium-binding protein [Candidatus Limnocylindrales bacterium]|nr:calcium-binding protein [Candidatus Limnocylindrales bacterium]